MSRLRAAALCLPIFLAAAPAQAGQRIVALDQCADQYVMALVPRSEIAGVTPRADDDDAWLRTRAAGLPVRRPTAESMLATRSSYPQCIDTGITAEPTIQLRS